jgi:hypothetical protein
MTACAAPSALTGYGSGSERYRIHTQSSFLAGYTFPIIGPTEAQEGWKDGLSAPRALIMSWSAFES